MLKMWLLHSCIRKAPSRWVRFIWQTLHTCQDVGNLWNCCSYNNSLFFSTEFVECVIITLLQFATVCVNENVRKSATIWRNKKSYETCRHSVTYEVPVMSAKFC